jgi:SAM-dependent methyltransferase
MRLLARVCDAADWFEPATLEVVREALRETPRFHRKQWEFARIFVALDQTGVLGESSVGLALGAGRERLMYAVAPRVRHLLATDLYGADSDWPDASCDDLAAFVQANKPFPMDETRLTALRMDMRALELGDEVIDFCYSSCAVEHIGAFDDFRRHLREVARVLKSGGVYAFTTEFHFGEELIAHPGNYLFPASVLDELVAGSGLVPVTDVDARIAPHAVNRPTPEHPEAFAHVAEGALPPTLAHGETHLQLMRGRHPFTSVLVVLRKEPGVSGPRLKFVGLDESRAFLEEGVRKVGSLLERCTVSLAPGAYLRDGARPGVTSGATSPGPERTCFHTDYVWLGGGERTVVVDFDGRAEGDLLDGAVELRVHRYPTITATPVECVAAEVEPIGSRTHIAWRIPLAADDDYCYAVLGNCIGGQAVCGSFVVRVAPANAGRTVADGQVRFEPPAH